MSNSTSDSDNSVDAMTGAGERIVDFILPDIGEGIVECEIVQWHVKEGDLVEEDQCVADVSTDKALVEIPSMYSGRIVKLFYQQGDIAKVHSPMFCVAMTDSSSDGTNASAGDATQGNIVDIKRSESGQPPKLNNPGAYKVLATPAVRRIARENNLDLTQVPSTGKNGRILKEDALNYLAQQRALVTANSPPAEAAAPVQPQVQQSLLQDRVEPINGVRAIMAKTMTESVSSIPHFTYVDDVDMTELIKIKTQLKAVYAEQGIRLTMIPFFMKAMSLAIKQFPILNSRANEEFTELTYLASHNIGMAVDSAAGLLVPNVKNVQSLSILKIANETNRLTEQARSGRISPDELRGGTITLSNVGAIGGTAATPIINKPEVAIVALGKVQTLPRFDAHGNVQAKQIMTISWSGDHRIIDGATMAKFSNTWKSYLENPASMMMLMR